jgi:type IV secretory pathway TraG/TraD family ATPase VirD4
MIFRLARGFALAPFILCWWAFRAAFQIWKINWRFYKIMLGKKPKPTHGDADFAGRKTLKKRGHLQAQGWLVGVKDGKRLYTLPEASGIAMSPKGMGKTQTAIAQLRELAGRPHRDDVLIVDPAGDLRAGTREQFEAAGYQVRVIDFTDPRESDTYDVFADLKPFEHFNFDRQVDQLCQLVLPDDASTREAHFQEFARLLLAGLLTFLLETNPDAATLFHAVDILTTDAKRRNAIFSTMRNSNNAVVRQAVNAWDEAGDKEKGSFSTTLARKLKVWLRNAVKVLTQTNEYDDQGKIIRGWSWEEIYVGSVPTVTYIITGLGTGEGAAARLILGNAINARRDLWNKLRQKPERGLRILVDEARETGNCHAIMDANNELRKAGVSVMMWFLSARDVFDIYPQAKTLINNSDLLIFGGSKEMDFMEDVSRLIGEKTIQNPGFSTSAHGDSQSASEQARRVKKADEIRRMDYYDMIAVLGNLAVECQKPFKLTKRGPQYL